MQRPLRWPRVTGIEPPGALAVRAAILAANGYQFMTRDLFSCHFERSRE
jgi:hypothetical protein